MLFAQLGFFCLVIATSMAFIGLVFKAQVRLLSLTRTVAIFILMAYGLLSFCFLRDDFHVLYVMQHSSTLLPWYYKLCAVWGGHEGSVLLWVTILAFWTFMLSFSKGFQKAYLYDVIKVLLVVILGLLLFILLTSNPFELQFLETKTLGRDLNPLLQDPGFLLHPPLLYFGYVGYAIPYAFAMAALKEGTFSRRHLQLLKPWALLAWSFLTLGITLGSWWAYRELGWGGFWFWDPVENASIMPWLVGTALLHALMQSEKQVTFLAWTILLAITAFALSLMGTFLVRSGVLTSVHAFAVDPKRGLYILVFLLLMMLWAYGLYIFKAHRLFSLKRMYWFSRETCLLINNILLFVLMLIVLLGTLYPLIIDGLGLGKISVGAPYFNTVLYPLMLVFLLVMGFAIQIKWGEDHVRMVIVKMLWPILLAFLAASLWPHPFIFKAFLMLALAYWVLFSLLQSLWERRKRSKNLKYWVMFLAHFGFSLTVIGVVVTSYYGVEMDVRMQQGETQMLNGFKLRYLDERQFRGPNYKAYEVGFEVSQGTNQKMIYPQKRIYDVGQMVMTDSAIWANLFRDIYVSLGEPLSKNSWSVRLYYKPMVRFIWLGGLFMFFGGAIGVWYYQRWVFKKDA